MRPRSALAVLSALLMGTAVLAAEERDIAVELTVPDSAWSIAIEEAYQVNDEIWVISRVSRDPNIMGAQVISTVRDSARISTEDLPVKHIVIGKTWRWKNE